MAKKEQFEIRVDDKFMEALTILAKRTNKNRADVIRDALNYYENALNEWEKDRTKKRTDSKASQVIVTPSLTVPA